MTVPEDELERIDKFAVEHGYTRSGFLLQAAEKAISAAKTKANSARRRKRKGARGAADHRLRLRLGGTR